MWDEYGIAAYDLGGTIQPLWNTYFYMKEALKTQTPKLIVLDCYTATLTEEYQEESGMIKNTFGMKFSKNKIDAICASAEKSSDTAAALNAEMKPATQSTIEANRQVYDFLNFEDTSEFENAERGFITAPDTLNLRGENGRIVWTQDAYAFLDKDAPDTANPSLWRNTQLNHLYGL